MSGSTGGISSSNIASLWNDPTLLGSMLGGINVSGLQGVLQAQENQVSAPLAQLENQQSTLSAQAQAFSAVQGALSTVQTDAQALQTSSAFNQTTTPVSSSPTVATASGSGGPYGDYALAISSLATPGSIDSGFQAGSATTALGWNGNMTVTVYVGIPPKQTAVKVLVPVATSDSLQTISQNIQAAAANALPSGTQLSAIVLPTTQNGQTGNVLSLTVNGGLTASDVTTSGSVPSLGFTNNTTFSPASYTLNGVTNQSSTNTVSNAISGLSLNLLTTGSTTISVGQNPAGTATQVAGLVSDIQSAVTTIQKYTGQGQPLAGNAALNNVVNQMESILNSQNTSLAPGYQSLADMGLAVSYNKNTGGAITFNKGTFQSALTNNPQAVIGLFTGTGGVAAQLVNLMQGFTAAGTGVLATDQQAVKSQETLLSSQLTALQQTVTQQQKQLQTQFMDYLQQIASNSSQNSFISQYTATQSGQSSSGGSSGTSGG